MENFGKFCFIILALIVSSIVGGWVFQTLYWWFIVPIFTLPALSLPQAIGISYLVRYMTAQEQRSEDSDIEDLFKRFAKSFVMSFVVLGIGWIITLFL